eukprot:6204148-Alexandrium_andersonii.AAC.1
MPAVPWSRSFRGAPAWPQLHGEMSEEVQQQYSSAAWVCTWCHTPHRNPLCRRCRQCHRERRPPTDKPQPWIHLGDGEDGKGKAKGKGKGSNKSKGFVSSERKD